MRFLTKRRFKMDMNYNRAFGIETQFYPISIRRSILVGSARQQFFSVAGRIDSNCFGFGSVLGWVWTLVDQFKALKISQYCLK